ncbi:MAG: hypothetical protein WBM44_23390 [Waterburya sp.]
MENFLKYLASFLFWFFSSIGTAAISPDGIAFILGIFIVAMIIFIVYLMMSRIENKLQIISTSAAGLVGGIVAVAEMSN